MKNTGGAAFPNQHVHPDTFSKLPGWKGSSGMTLRDYFAGQALAGRNARDSIYATWKHMAMDCYEIADAMLDEREKESK